MRVTRGSDTAIYSDAARFKSYHFRVGINVGRSSPLAHRLTDSKTKRVLRVNGVGWHALIEGVVGASALKKRTELRSRVAE